MNHKPGSVPKSTLLGSAICLKEPFPDPFFAVYPRLIGGQPSRIFDFAPDEACRFPASPENGKEVLPAAKLLPKSNKSWNLADAVTNAEVGSYPAFSPLSDRQSG